MSGVEPDVDGKDGGVVTQSMRPRPDGMRPVRSVTARAMAAFKRHKRLVQVAVLLLIAIFLGTALAKSWRYLQGYSWHVNWGLFVLAFALLVGQEITYGFIWRAILGRMGSRLDPLSAQRVYLSAEFVRYIPGNVWHVITRVMLAEQKGVPKATGLASMVIELATKITAGVLVFAVSLLFWNDTTGLFAQLPHDSPLVIGAILIPLLLLGLHPRLLRGALNLGLRKLGKEPVEFTLGYADVLMITLYWALSWLLAGAGFYLLVRSVVGAPLPVAGFAAILIAAGIYSLGWDIGFLSFITPSGIGFREAAIAVLVVAAGFAPVSLGIIIAFLARLFNTGAELLCITGAHVIRGTPQSQPTPHAPPQSQTQPQPTPRAGAR